MYLPVETEYSSEAAYCESQAVGSLSSLARYRQSMGQFSNPEMCKLTEQVIFMDPYYDAPLNRWTSPMLDDDVHELQADDEARLATAELRRKFLSQPEALIHGDLHTGSLMVTQNTTYAIDSEFAFYGPMGFDIGKIIGNFLLGYFAVDGYSTTEDPRTEQRQWLLDSAEKVCSKFCYSIHLETALVWSPYVICYKPEMCIPESF